MKYRNLEYPCLVFRVMAHKKTHPSMLLFWSMSNTLSMFLLNFLGSVCYFGCLFCLCMSTSSHVSGVLNIVALFSMHMCLFGWLSTMTQSRLLSMTIERRGGCGAGEPGYLAAFPASLCPGQWPTCCCYCQLVVQVNNGPGLGGCISYQHPCLFRAWLPDCQIPGTFGFPLLSALLLS